MHTAALTAGGPSSVLLGHAAGQLMPLLWRAPGEPKSGGQEMPAVRIMALGLSNVFVWQWPGGGEVPVFGLIDGARADCEAGAPDRYRRATRCAGLARRAPDPPARSGDAIGPL